MTLDSDTELRLHRMESQISYLKTRFNEVSFQNKALESQIEQRNRFIQSEIKTQIESFTKQLAHRVELMAKQEVRSRVSDTGFRTYVNDIVKDAVRNYREFIKIIVRETMQKINTEMHRELRVTKAICYSMSSEIKYSYMHSPFVSLDACERIVTKVKKQLDQQKIEPKEESLRYLE